MRPTDQRRDEVSGHVRLRELKSGPTYYASIRLPDGRRLNRKLGRAWLTRNRPPEGYLTPAQAEVKLEELIEQELSREASAEERVVTFREIAEAWYEYVSTDRKRKRSTLLDYRRELDTQLLPRFGDRPALEITTEEIDAWRRELVAEGRLAPRTINKRLTQIYSIYHQARRAPYRITYNPAADVDQQPVQDTGELNVLDQEQIEQLIIHASEDQDAVLYRVATTTGLRLGELRALRWSDVDYGRRVILVKRSYTAGEETTPKSGKIRQVPVARQTFSALELLKARRDFTQPDDLVFISATGSYLDDSALRKRFHADLERAGLPRMRLHDLRHTFGTIAVQRWPITDVQAFMGHASVKTTEIYVHYVPRHDAADLMSELFDPSSAPNGRQIEREDKSDAGSGSTKWAGEDSNLRPTDYEGGQPE